MKPVYKYITVWQAENKQINKQKTVFTLWHVIQFRKCHEKGKPKIEGEKSVYFSTREGVLEMAVGMHIGSQEETSIPGNENCACRHYIKLLGKCKWFLLAGDEH